MRSTGRVRRPGPARVEPVREDVTPSALAGWSSRVALPDWCSFIFVLPGEECSVEDPIRNTAAGRRFEEAVCQALAPVDGFVAAYRRVPPGCRRRFPRPAAACGYRHRRRSATAASLPPPTSSRTIPCPSTEISPFPFPKGSDAAGSKGLTLSAGADYRWHRRGRSRPLP